jgi:multisubunit Na+/H+ antiporter MnhB subunit
MISLYLLTGFMLAGAIVAIETRNLLSSVISVGVIGFMLGIVFLMLGAPDIAITQMVVDVLVLIVLIRATISIDNTMIEEHRDSFAVGASLVFFGIFVVFASYAFMEMPGFGEPMMRVSQSYLDNGLTDTGAGNMVMAVLLDYRAYDTLGEAVVIFVAILGALVLIREKGKKKPHEPRPIKDILHQGE